MTLALVKFLFCIVIDEALLYPFSSEVILSRESDRTYLLLLQVEVPL